MGVILLATLLATGLVNQFVYVTMC